ncbi:MAG TPA: hypothetical protein VLJ88_08100 [Propionibacteriaceae bacterium]|nr:hypothetical protein [Propionibacteriaceae bacterium]
MRVLGCLAFALFLNVVTATTVHAAPPPQAISRCGQTILDGDSYLTRDLTCSTGFVIAPGSGDPDPVGRTVSIDLRGHRLQGQGTGTAFDVDTFPGFSSISVRNGRIDHWERGIAVTGSAAISKVRLGNTERALDCDGGSCTVTDSVLRNNRFGIGVFEGNIEMTRSTLSGSEVGATIFGALDSGRFNYSAFTRNKIAVQYLSGPELSVTAHRNVFTGNGTGILGVALPPDSDYRVVKITENVFLANGDGVRIVVGGLGGSALVAGNLAVGNTRYGIYAPGATDGGDNRAARNGQPCVGVVCVRP